MPNKYIPYPMKNWSFEKIENYITNNSLTTDVSQYSVEQKDELIKDIKLEVQTLIVEENKDEKVIEEIKEVKQILEPVRVYGKHSCFVGGQRYSFLPNIEYMVTPQIKQILIDARIASR